MALNPPKLACCNFLSPANRVKEFALDHGFQGVDWSFTEDNLPRTQTEETALVKTIADLHPLEVRYHCFFLNTDVGALEPGEAPEAVNKFRSVCRLVSKLRGGVVTIHIGLGRDSTRDLSWEKTLVGISSIVRFAADLGIRVCVENLAWGWTSRPDLFEKLIRKTGCRATLDIGHARVSPSVVDRFNEIDDFVSPHPERILNAHVYHEETPEGHVPPDRLSDLEDRLLLLAGLPLCDWWVLELRDEEPLLQTLRVVREFVHSRFSGEIARSAAY
ncbi:MAG: TIM barrel protein [Desulfomonilaceae bacterium]|nr:TIM barrel protein [Desulfomonilaceae bacterium]